MGLVVVRLLLEDIWGAAKSLLGSTSGTSLRVPTLKVRSSLIPEAVRTRRSCRPRGASAAILSFALTVLSSTRASDTVVIPGW